MIWNRNYVLKFFSKCLGTGLKGLPAQSNSNSPFTPETSTTEVEGKLPLYWQIKVLSVWVWRFFCLFGIFVCLFCAPALFFLMQVFFLTSNKDENDSCTSMTLLTIWATLLQVRLSGESYWSPWCLYNIAEWEFWTVFISDSLTLSNLLLVAQSNMLHFNFSQESTQFLFWVIWDFILCKAAAFKSAFSLSRCKIIPPTKEKDSLSKNSTYIHVCMLINLLTIEDKDAVGSSKNKRIKNVSIPRIWLK